MTMQVLLGVPGAGKSYEAVQQAYSAVEAGRVVITNLPLRMDHEFWQKAVEEDLLYLVKSTKKAGPEDTDHFGHIQGWSDLIAGSKKYHREVSSKDGEASTIGPFVIVDEAMLTFQAMLANKRKSKDWADLQAFFLIHRHEMIDLLFMFHEHGQVDPAIKQLVERWYHIKNTSEASGTNTFFVGTSLKGFVQGNNYVAKRNGKFKKKIFELYDSYAEGSGAGTTGKKTQIGLRKTKPIWLRWWAILTMFLMVFVTPYAIYKTATGIKGAITPDDFTAPTAEPIQNGLPVLTEDERRQVEIQATNPQDALTSRLGWPSTSVPMIGFDNENLYFQDGSRLSMTTDILPSGFVVVDILLCRATISTMQGITERYVLEYKCAKGN